MKKQQLTKNYLNYVILTIKDNYKFSEKFLKKAMGKLNITVRPIFDF